MRSLIFTCASLVMLTLPTIAAAEGATYEGTWHTTNRKLDGIMICAVTDLGDEKWQGRFYGTWQGVPFDYTVAFIGPPSDVRGTATIDGASYVWKGQISQEAPGSFKGTFGGTRYTGFFDLKENGRTAGRK